MRPARTTRTHSSGANDNDHDSAPARHEPVLYAALAYAALGWPVFPLQPDDKVPFRRSHGFHDATTDSQVIRGWWQRCPVANVGIATGAPGPDVLDVDNKRDRNGFDALERLRTAGLLGGALRIVRTPSAGLHVYYAGSEQGNRANIGGHPLDFRGTGGYVVAPPSFVGGKPYVMLDARPEGRRLDLEGVNRLLTPARRPQYTRVGARSADGLAQWLAQQREGNRNAALFWSACRAVEQGCADALDALVTAAVHAGLPESEARRTVASAQRRLGGAA